jgi:hypothetical protein
MGRKIAEGLHRRAALKRRSRSPVFFQDFILFGSVKLDKNKSKNNKEKNKELKPLNSDIQATDSTWTG